MTAGLGLIVPVRLDALPIGLVDADENNYFAPAAANFSVLPYPNSGRSNPYLANVALSQPFTGNGTMPQGIHLHWQLPRALRAGVYDETGALSLPKAPDRWLITRIIGDLASPSTPVQLRSWVVESNWLDTTPAHSSTTIPWDADPAPQSYRYLGRVYDYDAWLADGGRGTYWSELTAMGYGIPDFAASYPNCRQVFGFLDATLNGMTSDPAQTAIAYSVTGWYADPADDPLRGGAVGGWSFDAPAGESPEFTLCQGFVYALNWRPEIAYFPSFEHPLASEIAVGNTPGEAFSALAAYKLQDEPFPNAETILDALQLGILPWLDQPGGTARLEEALFNDAFAANAGGLIWQLEPKGGDGVTAKEALLETGETLAAALERLNELQRTSDRQRASALSLQSQLFADWNKFMVIKYAASPSQYPSLNSVYDFLSKELAALHELATALGTTDAEIETQRAAVAAMLPEQLVLLSSPAPRYYQPDDPVVVLSGDGIPTQPPDSRADATCILTTQLLAAIELPASLVPGSAAITLDASELPAIHSGDRLPYPVIAQLAPAMMLADPQLAPLLTATLAAAGGAQNPAVLDFTATSGAIAEAQASLLANEAPANGVTFEGALPQTDIAFLAWDVPWHPIAMSWRFVYTPLAGSEAELSPTFILDRFTFDETSFDLQPKSLEFASASQQYTGTTLLSPDVSVSLQRQIATYLEYVDDPELRAILEQLGAYPLLAQSLSGFDASLLMLALTLQLPVADPMATDRFSYDFSNVAVRHAVGDQNKTAPLTSNAYNPFRAGRMQLSELRLIDEFGRFKTVDLSRLAVADTIPVIGERQLLPPLRIAQPARLDLRWLSAHDPAAESSAVPISGPICGWVVPNHLDNSLMFYDATGAAIGSLTRSGDSTRTIWLNAPGNGTPATTMEEAFANRNAVLTSFAFSIRDNGPAYIDALIRTIDRTKIFIAPQDEQQNLQTAVLTGSPLAIVQARAALQLFGDPSPDQSYGALQLDIDRGDPLQRTNHGFTAVRFPLLLGSLSQFDDGLIGYFLDDFTTFYAAAADGANAHIVQPRNETLTVAAADAGRTLTMLVDPRAGVHAFTGITPVKTLTIPPDWTATAMRAMAYAFLTTPILSLESGVGLPIPAQVPNATWSWIAYGTDGTWSENAISGVNLHATLQTPRALLEGWMKLLKG